MKEIPPLGTMGFVGLALVLALATAARVGYLVAFCDGGTAVPRFAVQGQGPRPKLAAEPKLDGLESPSAFEMLVLNLRKYPWFGSLAPLSDEEQQTAHVAPGYPRVVAWLPDDATVRRVQAGLGIVTVLLLFFYARMVLASNLAAFFVGILAAAQPFWIVNTGEVADGTLATFLLAATLFLGTAAARTGGPLTSLVFGLALACLSLVRASCLPFAFLALGWFLLRCRSLRLGWFAGLLALLGFGNGLAPWVVRNHQVFHQIVPVVDSAWLHVWTGVMPGATGGPIDEEELRASLPPERVKQLLAEPNEVKRYDRLSHDVIRRVKDDPAAAFSGRIAAATRFLFGDGGHAEGRLVQVRTDAQATPPIGDSSAEAIAAGGLIVLLALAFFGWRWSGDCSADCRLATLAFVWLPLPFLLSHAERLSGPRLPWDAILVLFAGAALAACCPWSRRTDENERRVLELQQQTTGT
jgi:hypothetical protein